MKLTFIGHAAVVCESRGTRILSDPWWTLPCFGVEWWNYPSARADLATAHPPDFIYISHGHNDHLHPETLRCLPTSATAIVSSVTQLDATLTGLGFPVLTLAPREQREIRVGLRVEILPTWSDDTLLVISDGEEIFLNLNDSLHSAPPEVQASVIKYLRDRYGRIDYVFCGYGTASHFPNCFKMPGKNDQATAARRQRYFDGQWSSIIHRLSPRFAFPFAADVVQLNEQLIGLTETIRNAERPTERFRRDHPNAETTVYDIVPGFAIEEGQVTSPAFFQPISLAKLRAEMTKEIATATQSTAPSLVQIEELSKLLTRNLELCREYLSEYPGSYRALIAIDHSAAGIAIEKSGKSLRLTVVTTPDLRHFDLIFSTRFTYLKDALTTPYADEVIFVGSGGTWTYRDRKMISKNLHRELAVLLRYIERPPARRFGDQPRWLFSAKQIVKRLLNHGSSDLYDLNKWIVFD